MKLILENTKRNYTYVKILNLIRENPESSLKEMGKKIKLHEVSVCNAIKEMEDKGWLETIKVNNGFRTPHRKLNYTEFEIKKVVVKCRECGNEDLQKSKYSKHKDLCQECTKKEFMNPTSVTCGWCNKELLRKNAFSAEKKTKFFHKECREKYREKVKADKKLSKIKKYICESCGKEMQSCKKLCDNCNYDNCKYCGSNINFNKVNKICSNELCIKKNYVDNDIYAAGKESGCENKNVPKLIFGYMCYYCGYNRVVQYHHVIEKRDGGENRLTNIIPLCPNHHQEVHKLSFDISEAIKKRDKVLKDIM